MSQSVWDPADPQWLAHRYDEASDQLRFLFCTRAERAAVPFLTDDCLPGRPIVSVPRGAAVANSAAAPTAFLFHSGFCCSTLLARCFDRPGLATMLSEPVLLNDCVGWHVRGATQQQVGPLLADSLTLLSRSFAGDRGVLIKPSCVVNGFAEAIMTLRPDARAVVLHAALPDFLASIAKKGMDGRLWVRDLFGKLRQQGLVRALGFTDLDYLGQTDLQIAGVCWLAQQAMFAALIARFPGRVRSLASDDFMDAPGTILDRAGQHWGLAPTTEQLAAMIAGPMGRNSKDGSDYSAAQRKADYAAAATHHQDEIAKVCVWIAAVAEARSIAMALPAAAL